ncbi:hypothetical protein FACS18949_05330 [Clostridia bacterium]|nr:hypothetical protein FACS18949_05330 [Clostridia bacterium]
MQTTNVVAETGVQTSAPEPLNLRKRIGSTTYVVNVRFAQSGKETMQDKVLRLIERDPLATQSTRCWPGGQVGVCEL